MGSLSKLADAKTATKHTEGCQFALLR